MVKKMEITSIGATKKVIIDGEDVSSKVSRVFMRLDPDGLPEVHLILTPVNLTVDADDIFLKTHIGEKEEQSLE